MNEQNKASSQGGIIYNITVKVEEEIAKPWLDWLLNEEAPAMLATNYFTDYRVVKLLELDDWDGPTYAVQYQAPNIEAYQQFMENREAYFRQQSFRKWGQRVVHFSTIMQVIQ